MLPDPIFKIFGRGIYMYGVMIAVGILACFVLLYLVGKKIGCTQKLLDFSFYNGIGAIAVGFFFAALWQAIYNYIQDPSDGFDLFGGGITVIGGVIGGAAFFLAIYFAFYRPHTKERILNVCPVAAPCILIAHAFGRIGCFFAGCCHGKVTDSFLGMQFPDLPYKVFPTQLYEAIFLFILCAVLTFVLLRFKYRLTFPVYMFSYALFRFLIEFLRGDDRGSFIPGISPSQFWCILIILGSIPTYILLRRAYKKFDLQNAVESTPAETVENDCTTEEKP